MNWHPLQECDDPAPVTGWQIDGYGQTLHTHDPEPVAGTVEPAPDVDQWVKHRS